MMVKSGPTLLTSLFTIFLSIVWPSTQSHQALEFFDYRLSLVAIFMFTMCGHKRSGLHLGCGVEVEASENWQSISTIVKNIINNVVNKNIYAASSRGHSGCRQQQPTTTTTCSAKIFGVYLPMFELVVRA